HGVCVTFQDSLSEEFPGLRAVEQADADVAELYGIEISGVDAHSSTGAPFDALPMRDAAAILAADETQRFVAPAVVLHRATLGDDVDVIGIEVRPTRAVTAADRTVAFRQPPGPSRDLDLHRAPVASAGEHGARPPSVTGRLFRSLRIGQRTQEIDYTLRFGKSK